MEQLGDYDQALRYAQEAVKLDPSAGYAGLIERISEPQPFRRSQGHGAGGPGP